MIRREDEPSSLYGDMKLHLADNGITVFNLTN